MDVAGVLCHWLCPVLTSNQCLVTGADLYIEHDGTWETADIRRGLKAAFEKGGCVYIRSIIVEFMSGAMM